MPPNIDMIPKKVCERTFVKTNIYIFFLCNRFDYNRLGGRGGRGGGRGGRGRGGGRGGGGASSMLAVRNIPPEMNSITHINAHFARFGNLQNIQVQKLILKCIYYLKSKFP